MEAPKNAFGTDEASESLFTRDDELSNKSLRAKVLNGAFAPGDIVNVLGYKFKVKKVTNKDLVLRPV